ncbi:hypothetical protein LEP1GSC065_0312 [Leptospira kirschneri serovar Sokoine str. RM1]|nr:hypothetical protein LEP1GSC065_0312 [Leptospira kirschneri serovar Sokoine str. RM1]
MIPLPCMTSYLLLLGYYRKVLEVFKGKLENSRKKFTRLFGFISLIAPTFVAYRNSSDTFNSFFT